MLNLINQRNLEVNSGCEINKHKTQNLRVEEGGRGVGGGGGEGGEETRLVGSFPLLPQPPLDFLFFFHSHSYKQAC